MSRNCLATCPSLREPVLRCPPQAPHHSHFTGCDPLSTRAQNIGICLCYFKEERLILLTHHGILLQPLLLSLTYKLCPKCAYIKTVLKIYKGSLPIQGMRHLLGPGRYSLWMMGKCWVRFRRDRNRKRSWTHRMMVLWSFLNHLVGRGSGQNFIIELLWMLWGAVWNGFISTSWKKVGDKVTSDTKSGYWETS